jgi:endoglucanase
MITARHLVPRSALVSRLARLALAVAAVTVLVACGPSGAVHPATPAETATATQAGGGQGHGQAAPENPPTAAPKVITPGYLHTSGSKIVDAAGKEVVLTGINWFGMETGTYAPHGIWSRNWESMLDQIADLGYNVIRLPYSNEILDPNSRPLEGVDYNANPDLRGLNGLEIMDKIVEGAGKRGIKIMLDRHRPTPTGQSKLWYVDQVSEKQWIADWVTLAKRYKDNDTVIAADLHNEPAGDSTWGTDDPKTDWRLAAERCGNAILSENPNWLIVVEGVEKYNNDWYWMGGSLQGAKSAPVRLDQPDKLVYSAHDYGPGVFNQGWFQDKSFPANLAAVWDEHWGYLVKQDIAPVIVGEFGGRSVGSDAEGVWQRTLVDYLKQNHISYTYWSLNPNSADTGGVLQDDWQTVNADKQAMLAGYQAPKLPIANPSAIDRTATAAARTNPLPAQQMKALFKTSKPEDKTNELALEVEIANQSAARIPIEDVTFSYWFAAPGVGPNDQTVSVDWASVDQKLMKIAVMPDVRDGQTYRIDVSFAKDAGMIQPGGNAEIKLRIKRSDQGTYAQSDSFSFKPQSNYGEDARIPLYFWGIKLWGEEPKG